MLPSLYAGVSGMKGFQTKLNVIGNNIANVNTYGFKEGRVTFKDMVSQTLQGAAAPGGNIGGINPKQVGLGATVGSIDTIDTQGSLQSTGRTLDLAIQGDGYFQVKDGNGTYYTRAGNFYLSPNSDGNTSTLVTATGQQVLDSPNNTITIPSDATNLSISPSGQITYNSVTNPQSTPQQLGIVLFQNPEGLTKAGDNLYQATGNSNNGGAASAPTAVAPGSGGAGTVQSGFLEMSNVDLSNEMTEMIVAQRGFQANTKIITTSDQILQDLISLKQ